jgi:hypothetical protein
MNKKQRQLRDKSIKEEFKTLGYSEVLKGARTNFHARRG